MLDFASSHDISYLYKIDSKCSAVSGNLFDLILLRHVVFVLQESIFEQLVFLDRLCFGILLLYLSLNKILSSLHENFVFKALSETRVQYPIGGANVFHAKSYYLFVYWTQSNRVCFEIFAPRDLAVKDCRYLGRYWFECRWLVRIKDQRSSMQWLLIKISFSEFQKWLTRIDVWEFFLQKMIIKGE